MFSFNRLELPPPTDNSLEVAFVRVRDLRVNGTLMTWKDVSECHHSSGLRLLNYLSGR